MNALFPDRCAAYLHAQTQGRKDAAERQLPAVTISRETGAGGVTIAHLVADYLQDRQAVPGKPWAVFDRNLVEKVIEEYALPKEARQFMAEDATSLVRDALEEILGLHPGTWTLTEHIAHTVSRLAACGNVVLVGRGANFITANLKHVFHVRLVAPFDMRLRRSVKYYGIHAEEAAQFVQMNDHARARYVLRHFKQRIANPLAYDMTINTARVSDEEAARAIGDLVLSREARLQVPQASQALSV